jgi:hypothetical protein
MRLVWRVTINSAVSSLNLLALLFSAATTLGVIAEARAGDAADKSVYGLLSPTPDKDLRDFSPDRPARSISPFTVDAGRFQIESDFINFTTTDRDGATTRTVQAADPVLKVGLTNAIDFEVTLGGFNDLRTRDDLTRATLEKGRGYGDTTFTVKINLLGNDDGKVAFALAPYIVAPTGARNITDGQVEGGVIAPLSIKLPQDFGLTLQTEVDALANEDGPGTHTAFTNVANVSHPMPGLKDLTAYAEFYSRLTTERRADDEYTFDLALAYLVEPNTQLDAGANIGLNRGADDLQVYSGIAHRF